VYEARSGGAQDAGGELDGRTPRICSTAGRSCWLPNGFERNAQRDAGGSSPCDSGKPEMNRTGAPGRCTLSR
jgi:hypothetical protein